MDLASFGWCHKAIGVSLSRLARLSYFFMASIPFLIRSSIDTLNFSQNSWISAFSPGVTRMCKRSLFGFSDGGRPVRGDNQSPPFCVYIYYITAHTKSQEVFQKISSKKFSA